MSSQVTEKPKQDKPTVPTQTIGSWVDKKIQFLLDKGWEIDGKDHRDYPMFRDPSASYKTELRKSKITREDGSVLDNLPTQGGGKEPLMQIYGAPIPWAHSLEDALGIQAERDRQSSAKK